jgi:hypothetical protein
MDILLIIVFLILGLSIRYLLDHLRTRKRKRTNHLYYKDVAITALRDSELIKLACDADLPAKTHEQVDQEMKRRNIYLDQLNK